MKQCFARSWHLRHSELSRHVLDTTAGTGAITRCLQGVLRRREAGHARTKLNAFSYLSNPRASVELHFNVVGTGACVHAPPHTHSGTFSLNTSCTDQFYLDFNSLSGRRSS